MEIKLENLNSRVLNLTPIIIPGKIPIFCKQPAHEIVQDSYNFVSQNEIKKIKSPHFMVESTCVNIGNHHIMDGQFKDVLHISH